MSDDKNLPKWIPVSVAVTTLSVPFLYIFGYAYDQGHLLAYGISNEFFARSPQEYLVFSFFAALSIATSALDFFAKHKLSFFVFALIVGCITLTALISRKYHIDDRLRNKLTSIEEHWWFDYALFPSIFAFVTFYTPFLLSAAISAILLIPAIAYFEGKDIAEKEIINAKICIYSNAPTEECVFLLENGKPIASGKFVARSPSHIALFNQGKTTIYPVKDLLVEVIPPSKKPKKNNP